MSSAFGDQLAALIARRGETMGAFAERTGVSGSTLSRIRHGERAPSETQAQRWAQALGLSGPAREEFLLAALIAQAPEGLRDRLAAAEERAHAAECERTRLAGGLGRMRAEAGFHDGWWLAYSHAFHGDGRVQRSLLSLTGGAASMQVRDGGLVRYRYHGRCESLGDKLFIHLTEERGIEHVQITLHALFDLSRPAFLFGLVTGISGTDRRHPVSWPTAARILLLHCGTHAELPAGAPARDRLEQCPGLYDPSALRSAWPAFLGDDAHLRLGLGLTDDEPMTRAVLRLIANDVPAGGVLRAELGG